MPPVRRKQTKVPEQAALEPNTDLAPADARLPADAAVRPSRLKSATAASAPDAKPTHTNGSEPPEPPRKAASGSNRSAPAPVGTTEPKPSHKTATETTKPEPAARSTPEQAKTRRKVATAPPAPEPEAAAVPPAEVAANLAPAEAPARRLRRSPRSPRGQAAPSGDGGDGQKPPEGHVIQDQPLSVYMEQAYKRYAIDTILDRALPDVRDGLKPVQRRILYTMHDMHLTHTGPTRKSARVVGDCMGKYHPHGDSSVYDAMVRMAQDFAMLHPLIDGQGNFGSADGDSQAAMRYTEARLSALGEMMVADIDKNTVDFKDNFDGSEREPTVLPARFPNLLVNGSSGIAVGMSTSILPHNLGEVCDAVIYLTKRWDKRERVTARDLMKIVPGPDLPTGGLLYRYRMQGEASVDMILEGYESGNTTLVCQSRADIQDIGGGKSEIIVTELPFQVQKNTVLERLAADRDKFPAITDVRDESDYHGTRVVFEVGRGADARQALDALLTYTQMRSSLSYNALALVRVEGVPQPQQLSLRQMLEHFCQHRLEVIVRRTQYDLERAQARLHIVEGLLKALDAIDEVIDIIRRSRTTETAQANLMRRLSISDLQATAILEMPLKRLAALERQKLADEAKELRAQIKDLEEIVGSQERRLTLLADETREIKEQFGRPRRTIIVDAAEGHETTMTLADLVTPGEPQRLLVNVDGIERRDAGTKRRGPRPSGEYVLAEKVVAPDATVFLISSRGKVWLDVVGRLPERATPSALGLAGGEQLVAMGTLGAEGLLLVTQQGNVKRMTLADVRAQATGVWAPLIGLAEGDQMLAAGSVSARASVLIVTAGNASEPSRALHFGAQSVNTQSGPAARGVAAIRMVEGDPLVSAAFVEPEEGLTVVAATRAGLVKRMSLAEFPVQGRAGKGLLLWKITAATGPLAGAVVVRPGERVDVLLADGTSAAAPLAEMPPGTRASRGVPLPQAVGGKGPVVNGLTVRLSE